MFQKDYWSMSQDELTVLAQKFNIPDIGRAGESGSIWYFNRDYVIASLVNRDTALRTRTTSIIAIASLVISLIALVVSILKK